MGHSGTRPTRRSVCQEGARAGTREQLTLSLAPGPAPAASLFHRRSPSGTWLREEGCSAAPRALRTRVPDCPSEGSRAGSDHAATWGPCFPLRKCQNSFPCSGWPRGAPRSPEVPSERPLTSLRVRPSVRPLPGALAREPGTLAWERKGSPLPACVAPILTERDLGEFMSNIQAAPAFRHPGPPKGQGREAQGGSTSVGES